MPKPSDKTPPSVGLSLNWGENGLKFQVHSRWVNARDQLMADRLNARNPHIDRRTSMEIAQEEVEVEIFRAAAKAYAKRVGVDVGLAERTLSGGFIKELRKQENVEGTLEKTAESLVADPGPSDAADSGPSSIEPDILNRIETYAEGASSEELRTKWGKVLASEIRKPGTFSTKVLRVIDELDGPTAAKFERLCEARLGDAIVNAFLPSDVNFFDLIKLSNAGLLSSRDVLTRNFASTELTNGLRIHFQGFGRYALGFPAEVNLLTISSADVVRHGRLLGVGPGHAVGVMAHILTDEGTAIATILEDRELATLYKLASEIHLLIPEHKIYLHQQAGGDAMQCFDVIEPTVVQG